MANSIADNVLKFWFGAEPLSPETDRLRGKTWFVASQDVDYDIERRFGKLVSSARAGSFDSWAMQTRTCLALILILDQFPRNLYRGQAAAFASDAKALELARALLHSGRVNELSPSEQAFALMPYQHAEDLATQREGVQAFQTQADSAPDAWRETMQGYVDFAQKHLDIVEQFGRFPHRNAALSRKNSAAEQAYLTEGGQRFGQ